MFLSTILQHTILVFSFPDKCIYRMAQHHTTPWMNELRNANITDRFVAIPYCSGTLPKSDSHQFAIVFRADSHKALSETDLCISARQNRMALSARFKTLNETFFFFFENEIDQLNYVNVYSFVIRSIAIFYQ